MIIGKNIKHKRILFTLIMIFEYILLLDLIKFNVLFQFMFTFMTYINLKVLYKEKTQITDIFLFTVASIILIISSAICYLIVFATVKNYYVVLVMNRIIIFLFLYLNKNNINRLYKKFYSLWNRHNNPKAIKSLTLRNISVIMFNLMFWIINLGMIYSKFLKC